MAKKTIKGKPAPEVGADARPASARVYLPDKKNMAEGLENVGPGKIVRMVITGTVQSFTSWEWDSGAEIDVSPTAISIETDEENITLDDAISGAAVRV